MKKIFFTCSFLFFFLLSGCYTFFGTESSYTKPINFSPCENSIIINKPYATVWSNLIEHLASTYFGIDKFEKESGLMTLTFSSSHPSDFITGGNIKIRTVLTQFDGEYVDYLSQYMRYDFIGKMNIVIKSVDQSSTKIIVNARYVFTSTSQENLTNTWSFNTNNESTIRVSSSADRENTTRTLCPTHKAENDILNALRNM